MSGDRRVWGAARSVACGGQQTIAEWHQDRRQPFVLGDQSGGLADRTDLLIRCTRVACTPAQRGAVNHDRPAGPQQSDAFGDEVWLVKRFCVDEDQVIGVIGESRQHVLGASADQPGAGRADTRLRERLLLFSTLVFLFLDPIDSGVALAGVNTWTTHGPEGGIIYALAIDPSSPATLYAGTDSNGVYKSVNGGASWTAVNAGLTNTTVLALAVDPSAPAKIYAGTFGGAFKSIDGGGSWTTINAGLAGTNVDALAIDPSNPATIYAGSGGGVSKSVNGGQSWTAMNAGLT